MRLACVVLFLLVISAACGGTGSSATPAPKRTESVTLVASDRLFDLETIRVAAETRINLKLENEDADPHNVAIYKSRAAEEEIFVSETIAGRGTETTGSFDAPAPGKYFFRCDVHPVTMIGDFIVE